MQDQLMSGIGSTAVCHPSVQKIRRVAARTTVLWRWLDQLLSSSRQATNGITGGMTTTTASNLYNGFRFPLSRLNNRTEIRTNRPADGNDPCGGSKTTPFSPTTNCARAVRDGPS